MSKTVPIGKTKITVPSRRPELLSRPRLLGNLSSLLDNKLILLSAPAGYGKTSLMIDLANQVEMPVCWLSLDLPDRDPQRFIAYFIAAVQHQFPGVGKISRRLLNQLRSIDDEIEPLLVTFTNEIYDEIEEDFLLILDDYHLLDDIPSITSIVNRFLELVAENCHIILSSRTVPNLMDVTLMVAREQVAGINHSDLAFSARELQALYAQNYHQHLSDENAEKFITESGGWITGIVLSNISGIPRVSGVDTFAYLGQQVLDQQPQAIRDFLMRTSLADEFNAEFCQSILSPLYAEPQNWIETMSLILEKNLFVIPVDNDGRWLRYHPLFRDFLQKCLREQHPKDVRPIMERMVKAYEGSAEWEKAYFTCRQLDDQEALADVVEKAGTPMLQSALVTLEGWVNSLPPALVQTRPGLISLRGPILAVKGNPQGSMQLLNKAVSIYRQKKDTDGLILALIRRANTLRILGEYSQSLENAEEALILAGSAAEYQSHYAEALRIKGLDLYRLGESRTAADALEHSLSLFTAMEEENRIPILLMESAMVHVAVGEVDLAKSLYMKALQLKQTEKDIYTQAEIMNNLGSLYLQIGEYELASETFESGLLHARKSRNQRAEALILTGLGDLYGEIEDFETAQQAYNQAASAAGEMTGFVTNYLIVARGNLAIAQNDLDTAAEIIQKHRRAFKSASSAYERGVWQLFEGRYLLNKKETKKAMRLLDDCRQLFLEEGRDWEWQWQWSILWLSAAHCQLGEKERAAQLMQEIISEAAKPDHALLVTFRQVSPWLKDLKTGSLDRRLGGLFEKANRLGSRLPLIRRNLRRHANFIRTPFANLMIRALGNPEVSVNGSVVQMSDWRTQSVRDLFLFFLQTEEAVTKEQVGVELWPETPNEHTLKARFKNEIYRLRRAVGKDVIVFDDELYRFNRQMDYEYDVEAFDSHILRAHKTSNIGRKIEHLRSAVDLVHGPYLADVSAEWAAPERERLWQAYGTALEELAYLYLDTGQLENCLQTCQLALKRDSFQEVIYQIEMRAHAALGDRSAVTRRYQACRTAMDELGVPISPETERIYRELTG